MSNAGSPPVVNFSVRKSGFLRRLGRYGFVGGAISLFYSAGVIACMQLLHPISPTLASVIAFVITLPLSYLAHSRITFSDSPSHQSQLFRFVLTTATSFAIAVAGMYWLTAALGWSYMAGIAWNWIMIPFANFLAYSVWVFRNSGWKG